MGKRYPPEEEQVQLNPCLHTCSSHQSWIQPDQLPGNNLSPPGTGVPTAGITDGSNPSRSKLRYTSSGKSAGN